MHNSVQMTFSVKYCKNMQYIKKRNVCKAKVFCVCSLTQQEQALAQSQSQGGGPLPPGGGVAAGGGGGGGGEGGEGGVDRQMSHPSPPSPPSPVCLHLCKEVVNPLYIYTLFFTMVIWLISLLESHSRPFCHC